MKFKQFKNGVVLKDYSEFFCDCKVNAYFTTKIAGAEQELNFSQQINQSNHEKNLEKLTQCLPPKKRRLYLKQIHGNNIIIDDGKINNFCGQADGLISKYDDVILQTAHADCLPIYAAVKDSDYFGLAHSGRTGSYQEIARELVTKLADLSHKNTSDIKVLIGVGIDSEHYEVNRELYQEFLNKFGADCAKIKADKYYLDLQTAVLISLKKAGVLTENILIDQQSSYLSSDYFYSYRRQKDKAGRMLAIISKKIKYENTIIS